MADPTTITPRRLLPNDPALPGVLNLVLSSFADIPGSPSANLTLGAITKKVSEGPVFVIKQGNDVIACLFTRPSRDTPGALYIGPLAVAVSARGQGLARRLIEAAAEAARTRDKTALTLDTGADLDHLHRLFTGMGFVITAQTQTLVTMQRLVLPDPELRLRTELERITRATPFLIETLKTARDMDLPDCWLVAGAIYNRVWNHLTDRPARHGINDIDLFYFDPDTSWAAEDREIKRAATLFAPDPPVELRNQARVHLWFEDHFGQPYTPLASAREGIDRFACKTHSVGLRLTPDDTLEIYAPYGLADIFALRVTPNPVLNNRATHEAKAARQKLLWPELTVIPWP